MYSSDARKPKQGRRAILGMRELVRTRSQARGGALPRFLPGRLVPSLGACLCLLFAAHGAEPGGLAEAFTPPVQLAKQFGRYSTLLRFRDGRTVKNAKDWEARRKEIRQESDEVLGPWPPLLPSPRVEVGEVQSREDFTQRRVRVEISSGQMADGYLLVPRGQGPFPAVLVPYYEPETSVGLSKQPLRDFGYQLARRGFVTLSIGSPGGEARQPAVGSAQCQPLSFLAYVAANCHTVLAQLKEVDPERIGVVGHSYGGKWAMFAACLYDKFAAGVWSDPGIVFDESRPNVNYWEPWYLGWEARQTRRPGVPTETNPRTGAYRRLVEAGRDLHELLALMAPRPFLVSGGSEDPPSRWMALGRVMEVYEVLGVSQGVGMTNRKEHTPNPESNEKIYQFFTTRFLPQRQRVGQ